MAPRSRDSIMTYNTFFNQAKEYGGIRNGLHVRYILWRGNFRYWCVKSPLPGSGVQFCRVSQTMRVITGVSSAATHRKNQCGNLSDPTDGFWLRKESERLQVRKKNYYVSLEVNGYIRYTLNHFIDELSIVICRDSNKHSCIGKVSVNVHALKPACCVVVVPCSWWSTRSFQCSCSCSSPSLTGRRRPASPHCVLRSLNASVDDVVLPSRCVPPLNLHQLHHWQVL